MSTSGVQPPLRGFAHVGIIVPEVETAAALFRDRLGAEVQGPESEVELGLTILWVKVGGVLLEFVAPATEDSRATAAIKRGETGVHHIAFEVDGLDDLLGELIDAGVPCATRRHGAARTAAGSRSWTRPPAAVRCSS